MTALRIFFLGCELSLMNQKLKVSMHAVATIKRTGFSQLVTKTAPSPWLLRSIFDAYPSAVAVLDESGIILHTNQVWNVAGQTSLTGPQRGVGQNYIELCENIQGEARRDAKLLANGILRVIKHDKESFFFEYSNATHSFFVHSVRMNVPGYTSNILVTHQTLMRANVAAQVLTLEQQAICKAFHFVPQPMSLTTLADGRYIDVNETFLSILGFEREEVIGHTSLELGIWASRDERARFVSKLIQGSRVENEETRLRDKSGQERVWLSSAELIELQSEKYLLL